MTDLPNGYLTVSASRKTRVLILAGGMNVEHNQSIISARIIIDALSEIPQFEVLLLIITRAGKWLSEEESQDAFIRGHANTGGQSSLPAPRLPDRCDVVWSLIGPWASGGAFHGFLEIEDVPYVGCGILASALCKDKALCKEVLKSYSIPMLPHVVFTREAYLQDPDPILLQAKKIKRPCFVKPVGLCSSVGISKVEEEMSLDLAIKEAMKYDRRIMIEEGVRHPRELRVAVFGDTNNPVSSSIGECFFDAEFFDYNTKYSDKKRLQIPAEVSDEMTKEIKDMALKIFQVLDCSGFVRVDFFLDPQSGAVYFNEVNNKPGFTPNSPFPKLVNASGYTIIELCDLVIRCALLRRNYSFNDLQA